MAFVHLHTHSQFSILDGTSTVDALVKRAAALGQTALALTDTGNLYGAVAFFKACKGAKIRPILGAELHVQPEGIEHVDPMREEGGYQIVVLVEDDTGYANLCQLVTDGIFDGMSYKPRVDLDRLEKHREGLLFLTGGSKGVLGRSMQRNDEAEARQRLADLVARVGRERLFVELSDQGLAGQEDLLALCRQLAHEHDLPTVVTNAVHYLSPEDAPVHDVLNAIATAASLADDTRLQCPTDQAYLKSEEEMRSLFPEDLDAIERTAELAERCHFKFEFGVYHFPATTPPDAATDGPQPDTDANWAYFYAAFPPPRDFGMPDPVVEIPPRPEGAGNIDGYFGWYSRRGLELRLQRVDPEKHPAYWERLESELVMIVRMGFPAYLLIVAEFINWSKDNDIPVGPGRGSAAGSLVAWAMRITDIDPIRYGLLMERFLNPERVSMPDIDVDFCQDRREEAIEHVRQKYGTELVSQIITYGALKAKAAVRDVARVLDLNFQEADRIAKLVPDQLGIKLSEAIEQEPRLRDLRDGDPKVRRVLALAQAIEGTYRQTGVHAAGVVIADRPLVEYAPLYRDEPGGGPVVQYDMKSAESIGLIKFDFLGLKTLDQIRDAVASIRVNHGIDVDMSAIPEDDEQAYALLQDGDALGVFQLESSGMRELLTRLRPNCMDDMVALVALYRPGPLQSGMVDDFVERKHGRVPVEYALPQLEPILAPTYGTVIYQEQVMQIAQVLAGYSLGEADLLRRAMGKKNAEEMAKQRTRFVDGAIANEVSGEKAGEIFDMMEKFAAYGFNKSHSAAYGYIAYQTAWLKARYRPEYMAALMTIEAASTDKILTYILDCRKVGIQVLPVCLNASVRAFSVPPLRERTGDGQVIRFGLAAVRNVGEGAIEAILEARKAAGGRFRDAMDFFERVDYRRVNRRVLEGLVKAGAFDFTGVHRGALMAGLDAAITLGTRAQEDRAAGQIGLFAAAPKKGASFRFPDIPEWPLSQKLAFEKEVLGLYLSGHPMQAHTADIARFATRRLAEVGEAEDVRVLGMVVDTRVVRTRRNDKMAFVRLEDAERSIECVFFSEAWSRSQRAIEQGEPVLVSGKVEPATGDDEPKLRANSAEPLSELRGRMTREVRFRLTSTELQGDRLDRFLELLQTMRGACRSRLFVTVDGRFEAELGLPQLPVEPSVALEESVTALFGRTDVVALSS
ncbi:MAG: DNA polymerase III subunit alpha [Alphaproteobacteria bacterium]|nr:DNA polymerase III subunit alpha [Alphaproteobacteria bacterium]